MCIGFHEARARCLLSGNPDDAAIICAQEDESTALVGIPGKISRAVRVLKQDLRIHSRKGLDRGAGDVVQSGYS